MRSIIFFVVFFLWNSAATFPQTPKQQPKATGPTQQSAKPSVGAQAKQPAKPAAKPASEAAPKEPKAAAKQASAPNAELEKLKAEQAKLKAEQERLQKAQQVVQDWFRRWNALDGTEESINRFVELYHPDAMHVVSPREGQSGPVAYEGHEYIRKMAEGLGKTYSRLAYYIKVRTVDEKTAESIYTAQTPWGATGVVVEFGASYDFRENNKRFMVPGAAFFEVQEGKIRKVRLYDAAGETFEVVGSRISGCGN